MFRTAVVLVCCLTLAMVFACRGESEAVFTPSMVTDWDSVQCTEWSEWSEWRSLGIEEEERTITRTCEDGDGNRWIDTVPEYRWAEGCFPWTEWSEWRLTGDGYEERTRSRRCRDAGAVNRWDWTETETSHWDWNETKIRRDVKPVEK